MIEWLESHVQPKGLRDWVQSFSQIIVFFHGQNMWNKNKINIKWFLQVEGDKVVAQTKLVSLENELSCSPNQVWN
jgi:hypothetical protein